VIYMAWENPVTTWGQAGKTVPVAGDFNRIEGNTQYLKDEVDSHKAEDASTTAKGHVQLNNTVTSTSTTQAATANAVKTVNDALTSHKAAAAPHSGHETPAGAQAKAEAAATAMYMWVGVTTQTVRKLNKSDLSQVATSASYGGSIYAIAVDDDYVYVGGGTQTVKKLNKSDLSQVAESATMAGISYAIAVDDNYVYVGGWGNPNCEEAQ
jgi:hypothetical protein